jgi:hypothetical protein
MSDLEALKKRHVDAQTAYFEYKPDGTVDGDMEEIKLLHKYTRAEKEYRDALKQITGEPITNPSTYAAKGEAL